MSRPLAVKVAERLRAIGDWGKMGDLPAVRNALPALAELVEAGDRSHYYCEDTWYACPEHEDYSGPEDVTGCNCGFKRWDEALRRVAESLGIK